MWARSVRAASSSTRRRTCTSACAARASATDTSTRPRSCRLVWRRLRPFPQPALRRPRSPLPVRFRSRRRPCPPSPRAPPSRLRRGLLRGSRSHAMGARRRHPRPGRRSALAGAGMTPAQLDRRRRPESRRRRRGRPYVLVPAPSARLPAPSARLSARCALAARSRAQRCARPTPGPVGAASPLRETESPRWHARSLRALSGPRRAAARRSECRLSPRPSRWALRRCSRWPGGAESAAGPVAGTFV
jgi:hypothetical protein